MRMITYSPPLYSIHTMIIAAIIPYSFSFCFSISHFNFCASERNNYASRLPSSSTSAVSAKASVLSTIMSSFSPRSMILSDDHPFPCTSYRCYRSLRPSLHPISAARASQRRRWGRSTSSAHHAIKAAEPSAGRSRTISWAIVEEKSDIANA